MLRIDVSVGPGHPTGYSIPPGNPFAGRADVLHEIWAFGLRNPWRYSSTIQPTAAPVPCHCRCRPELVGRSRLRARRARRPELRLADSRRSPRQQPVDAPLLAAADRSDPRVLARGRRAITGGFVYRGSALGGAYSGRYFFADISTSRVWSLGLSINGSGEATKTDLAEHTAELGNGANSLSSFGVDANGELYLVSYGLGAIYKIAFDGTTPPPPPPPPPHPPRRARRSSLDLTGRASTATGCRPDSRSPGARRHHRRRQIRRRILHRRRHHHRHHRTARRSRPGPDWTCFNGNWLPPGFPIPGGPPPPPPPPPPTDPPPDPPPPPPPSNCPTVKPGPDWTCFNGNWLPPGFPIPGGPPPPPPPPTDPPPPPPPPGSACTTVKPGPDWTCVICQWQLAVRQGYRFPAPRPQSHAATFIEGSGAGLRLTPLRTSQREERTVSMVVLVDLPFSCPWNALSDASWITVISPAFPAIARGDGSLRFIVQPNTTGVVQRRADRGRGEGLDGDSACAMTR